MLQEVLAAVEMVKVVMELFVDQDSSPSEE
jgi:hypothetical protein